LQKAGFFLFFTEHHMVAWALGRAAFGIARACGCNANDSAFWGFWVGTIGMTIDPIGGLVNIVHSGAQLQASNGSELAKAVNVGLNIFVMGDAVGGLSDVASATGSLSDVAASSAGNAPTTC
jgi:hypothetical protein